MYFRLFEHSEIAPEDDQKDEQVGHSMFPAFFALGSQLQESFLHYATLAVLLLVLLLQVVILTTVTDIAGEECTAWGPKSETHTLEFKNNESFQNTRHEFDHSWKDLIPKGSGIHREDGKIVGISMFHQLHCLASFRSAIQQLQDGKAIGHSMHDDMADKKGHWPHCFDYLKQILVCYADDTREPYIEEHQGVSGFGVQRVCRDSDKLYRLAMQTNQT